MKNAFLNCFKKGETQFTHFYDSYPLEISI